MKKTKNDQNETIEEAGGKKPNRFLRLPGQIR
jgi:hypothetical protein